MIHGDVAARVTWLYFVTDHLGSIADVTDETGAVVQRNSGACPLTRERETPGARRCNADGSDYSNCPAPTPAAILWRRQKPRILILIGSDAIFKQYGVRTHR